MANGKGTCWQCKVEFERKTSWQGFCSVVCRNAYHGGKRTELRRAKRRGVVKAVGLALVLAFGVMGCQRDSDEPRREPGALLPGAPVVTCVETEFREHGEFDPQDLRLAQEVVSVDGVTDVRVRYKDSQSVSYPWVDLVAGNQTKHLSYSVAGSSVTVTMLSVGFWEYEVLGVVTECY